MSGFHLILWELLPDLYRECDNGDLDAFLSIPADSLDRLKALIDRFPQLADVNACADRFVPLLGQLVGHRFDPIRSVEAQRRDIGEAVDFYRRKGTLPAMYRSLYQVGWQGHIKETYRHALRLNRRARINGAKIPGRLYSLGVYHLISDTVVPNLQDVLVPHHPAGVKAFYCQRLVSCISLEAQLQLDPALIVTQTCWGQLKDTFRLNHHALNNRHHLTRRQKTHIIQQIVQTSPQELDITRAGVCFAVWHGRRPGLRLNRSGLNQRLVNLRVTQTRFARTSWSETRPPHIQAPGLRLGQHKLNTAHLSRSTATCSYKFRQQDKIIPACGGVTAASNHLVITQWPPR